MRHLPLRLTAVLSFVGSVCAASGGVILAEPPEEAETSSRFLFYLHGGIIQEQGVDAVSPYFGKYQYTSILREFANAGYVVISERRPKGTKTEDYALKVAAWVAQLLDANVPPQNITIVGASMGAGIAVDASIRIKNDAIKFCLLGICKRSSWDYYLQHYPKEQIELRGVFLSIYEQSDSYGSCDQLIGSHSTASSYEEVALDMGLGHGFLYEPYEEWFTPLLEWIDKHSP